MSLLARQAARPVAAAGFMIAGLLAPLFISVPDARQWVWMAGLLVLGLPIVARTLAGLLAGRFAADVVASLAVVAAAALVQPFAGLVIVLMQTGGEALEDFAARRASRAVEELEAQAPRTAHRLTAAGVEDVPVERVVVGDRLLVRPGEMVPCDGTVCEGRSQLDVARITGEPLPRPIEVGAALLSGAVNLDSPIVLEATAPAALSLYHRIVELVRSAQASKAPLQRVADRAAVWFTPATLAVCLVAWLASGDPLRVLAVLVIATPCPLILAAPVAILGGINRAARHQIVVRHGGALEQLAAADTVVFDKTGTLTLGRPTVHSVRAVPPFDEAAVLRFAGAVEHGSGHLLARTLSDAAIAALGDLPAASDVLEAAGRGVRGTVEGHRITVGAATLLREWEPKAFAVLDRHGDGPGLRAYVAVDGMLAGIITYADSVRPNAPAVVGALARLGLKRQMLLSGDTADNARAAGDQVGIADARGDLLPEDKTALVSELGRAGRRVLVVGDGANDAPALAAASVGLALAAHGGGISAEAADVVLLADDLGRVPEAVAIARRTMEVARQSIAVGLGLSVVGMAIAAAGHIPPAIGALVQEAIDVAVILNALRAVRPGPIESELHGALTAAVPTLAPL